MARGIFNQKVDSKASASHDAAVRADNGLYTTFSTEFGCAGPNKNTAIPSHVGRQLSGIRCVIQIRLLRSRTKGRPAEVSQLSGPSPQVTPLSNPLYQPTEEMNDEYSCGELSASSNGVVGGAPCNAVVHVRLQHDAVGVTTKGVDLCREGSNLSTRGRTPLEPCARTAYRGRST